MTPRSLVNALRQLAQGVESAKTPSRKLVASRIASLISHIANSVNLNASQLEEIKSLLEEHYGWGNYDVEMLGSRPAGLRQKYVSHLGERPEQEEYWVDFMMDGKKREMLVGVQTDTGQIELETTSLYPNTFKPKIRSV